MKTVVVLLAGAIVFLSSCTDNSTEQLREVNRSLESSNTLIAQKTKEAHMRMERLKAQPAYSGKLDYPLRRADAINKKSTEIVKYIKSLKDGLGELEKEKDIVKEVFETQGKGLELYKRIAEFVELTRKQFRDDDEYGDVYEDYLSDLNVINNFRENDNERAKMWVKLHFQDANVLSARALLSTLQNDVLIAENRLVDYFYSKVVIDE
jgi:hypothetical protein